MGSTIRLLSEHTINKIAAGEVIENPASVVKELVENSLDAGATEIYVEIKGGGRQLIRISDNGCGMGPDDAVFCLERHATSKLREVEEIHSLETMGFRGEAIPSIAAISKFTILTTPANSQPATKGTLVIVDGGKILNCAEAARSQGTTIEVKSLFFNVPVRKKFQKSPIYDSQEILKVLSSLALGHPQVSFQLISQEKIVLNAPHCSGETFLEKLQNRVTAVLGADFVQGMKSVQQEQAGIKLQGLFALPMHARHNRTGQYLFINHRAVFSPLVAFAVKEGYKVALPSGKYPVFVLHLNLPGHLVDVNVHPQKREVRLRQDQLIKDLIFKAVNEALQSVDPLIPVEEPSRIFSTPSFDREWVFKPRFDPPSYQEPIIDKMRTPEPPIYPALRDIVIPSFSFENTLPRVLATIPRYILLDGASFLGEIRERFVKGAKIGIFLVDQKAAYTRIVFEKLEKQLDQKNTPLALQSLLIPYTFDLTPYESSLVREYMESFHQMGLQIKEFGQNTFILDALPEIFGSTDMQLLVIGLLETLKEKPDKEAFFKDKAKRIALTATRASVSHEKKYSHHEAQKLTDQLFMCHNPFQCPQGKSTVVHLDSDELAKQFQKC